MRILPNRREGYADLHFEGVPEAMRFVRDGLGNRSLWGWALVFRAGFIDAVGAQPLARGVHHDELGSAASRLSFEASFIDGGGTPKEPSSGPVELWFQVAQIGTYLQATGYVKLATDALDHHLHGQLDAGALF